jgi:phage regulator Rha-like protein
MRNIPKESIVPIENIRRSILLIRGQKVMIDADVANLYGVTTKALNQAIKRNKSRFPQDFVFALTQKEKEEVVTFCDHLKKLKYSPNLPLVFTEHGALMAAAVLNSQKAIEMSLLIVRTFVQLRRILAGNAGLASRLDGLEKKYNKNFSVVFEAIRKLMDSSVETPRNKIGFHR